MGSNPKPLRVRMTLEFPEYYRRAINAHRGQPGLATREECKIHVDGIIGGDAETICAELRDEEQRLIDAAENEP